ncbi:MAG: GAF domain-containing sensor histidine kinase [Deltaproteobacteria bacterium]|nr:GAF domain-containing sensor histidine kinase [Deltaproteobacteria bacterium]MBI2342380.1 GAF domain-containing sensor histidine kinase [Deltaproteobacteria bacterium]MBI2974291.1 GAF domain-containing sensor histidine kinase [Deltaproteobacteria bacterium]
MLQVICDIVGSHDASLLLKDNGEYVVKESFGSKPASFQVGDISIFLKWLTKFGHTVSRYQLVNRKEFAKIKGEGLQYCVQFHAEACVPLFIRGELLGVINIGSRASGELYDGPTRELLDILGGQSSVAIHNASLYEDTVRRNIQLQEVARLKSQLLSNVSHEFRTPLNSIIGLTEIIMDGGDGPVTNEQREHLKMVALSGSRLLETVSSMVDLAKLEANHLSLNVRRLNLTKMVSKVADGLSKTKDTSFKLSLNKETPPIYGDEGWLEKLFSHVLNNAVKYTPNGEIIIDAEKSGEMLKVGVHDTGVGIALERQNEIFDSFVQGNGGVERPFEGSGMGLAISKKVIELHGGRIWLTSSPGKGAHFFFTLPLKPTSVKSVELKQ